MTATSRPGGFGTGFKRLWFASAVSGLGDGSRIAALAVFAAVLTDDPTLVASVLVAARLPWVVVGPFAGLLVDRVDRWRTLWICHLARAVITGGFVLAVLLGVQNIGVLVATTFALSSVGTLADNLAQGLAATVAGSRSLDSTNSRIMSGQVLSADFAGAPLGTALFVIGRSLPFVLDMLTFVAAAALVFSVRTRRAPGSAGPAPMSGRRIRSEIGAGFRWMLRNRAMRSVCLLAGLTNFCIVAVLGIAPLYALRVLHVAAGSYGLLLLVIAAGGLAGMLAAPRISAALGPGGALQLTFGMCPLPFLIAGLTSNAIVAAAALAFVGASITIGGVVTTSLRQQIVPAHLFGRVNGVYRLVVNGLSPLGGLAGGVVAGHFGLRAPFLLAASLLVAPLLAAMWLLPNRVLVPAGSKASSKASGGAGGERHEPVEQR